MFFNSIATQSLSDYINNVDSEEANYTITKSSESHYFAQQITLTDLNLNEELSSLVYDEFN